MAVVLRPLFERMSLVLMDRDAQVNPLVLGDDDGPPRPFSFASVGCVFCSIHTQKAPTARAVRG